MPTPSTFTPAPEETADIAHLLSIATFLPRFTVSQWGSTLPDPEAHRGQRTRLRWLAENFQFSPIYRARTWGYTVLRTTYADDAAFHRAVEAIRLFVRARIDAEADMVTGQLKRMDDLGKLPEGIAPTADPRPGDELYKRFVLDIVEDREGLEGVAGRDVCAYFKRWALEKWGREEWLFSAASPRLKTAMLLDEETVAHLQGLAEALEDRGKMTLYEVGNKFWVKMVEADPEERYGPKMNMGWVDVYRLRLGRITGFYWDRDMKAPAYLPWKQDEGVPGGWVLDYP